MKECLEQYIIITVATPKENYGIPGILKRFDDSFLYLDISLSGEVETAIGISTILSVEHYNDMDLKINEDSGDFTLDDLIAQLEGWDADLEIPKLPPVPAEEKKPTLDDFPDDDDGEIQ